MDNLTYQQKQILNEIDKLIFIVKDIDAQNLYDYWKLVRLNLIHFRIIASMQWRFFINDNGKIYLKNNI